MSFMRCAATITGGSVAGVSTVTSTGLITAGNGLTVSAGAIDFSGTTVANKGDFALTTDLPSVAGLATEAYVDSSVAGLAGKAAVQVASTAGSSADFDATGGVGGVGTLTSTALTDINGDAGFSAEVGATNLVVNDLVFVQNAVTGTPANGALNANSLGIWQVTTVGNGGMESWVLTRYASASTGADFDNGYFFFVLRGATNGDKSFIQTTDLVATDTTSDINTTGGKALAFAEFGASSGSGVAEGDSPTWTGAHTFNGNATIGAGASLILSDSGTLQIGGGGATRTIAKSGENLLVSNSSATGQIIQKLGTATAATEFRVTDNADAAVLRVLGDGKIIYSVHTETMAGSDASLTVTDRIVEVVSSASGLRTLTIASTAVDGQMVTIIFTAKNTNNVTLTISNYADPGTGSVANTSFTLENVGQSVTLFSNGTNWYPTYGGLS